MQKRTWILVWIAMTILMMATSCPLLPVDMLDNPGDPGGGNYQGYPVIADPNDIEGWVEDGAYLAIPRFVVSQVQNAQAYRLQVATDTEFTSIVYDEDGYYGNMMIATGLGDLLTRSADVRYWKACAKVDDTWGLWSEVRSFVYMHPNTVYFDAQGGSNPVPAWKATVSGQPYGVLPVVYKTSHVFDGWWTGVGGTRILVTATSSVDMSDGHTLHAKWLPPHTVSFISDGGSAISPLVDVVYGTIIEEPSVPTKVGYVFDGWYTESELITRWNFSTDMVITDKTLYAKWNKIIMGPAGGYIFFDKGNYNDGWRYLEAAPVTTEWRDKQWGGYGTNVGGTGTGIGTGENNTSRIVWRWGSGDYAAKLCSDLVVTKKGVTYDDWFLPSKEELNQIYHVLKRNGVGGYANDLYSSSTEYDSCNVWVLHFSDGRLSFYGGKDCIYRVRAIRAF